MYGAIGITAEWLEARNDGLHDHIDDAKKKALAQQQEEAMEDAMGAV